jgi:predicted  nucleic acid-binding Zn-ribbon protein
MASNYERPDLAALSELELLLRHLGDEVAGWRRRTLKAEAELQEARTRGGALAGPELLQARQRVIDLEVENQALRQRIEGARERLQSLSSRLAFLETEEGAA